MASRVAVLRFVHGAAVRCMGYAWLHDLQGAVQLNSLSRAAGDGVAVSEEPALVVRATGPSGVMRFALP